MLHFGLESKYYVTVTHTGITAGTLTFYKDGIIETPQTTALQRSTNSTDITVIGRWTRTSALGNNVYFNGSLDDFRIYNSVISTSQIQDNYYTGLSRLLAENKINKMNYENRIAEYK